MDPCLGTWSAELTEEFQVEVSRSLTGYWKEESSDILSTDLSSGS